MSIWRIQDGLLYDTKGNPVLVRTVTYNNYLDVSQLLINSNSRGSTAHMYDLPLDKLIDNITKQLTSYEVDMDSGINERALNSIIHTATYQKERHTKGIQVE